MFASVVGCISLNLAVHDLMIGDVSKDAQYFLPQGLSEKHIETARVAWTCLTEGIVNRDQLGRVLSTKLPNAG